MLVLPPPNPLTVHSLMSGSVRRSVLTCCNRLCGPAKPEPCSEVASSRRWRGEEVSNRFEQGMLDRDQTSQSKRKATLSTTIDHK